MDENEWEKVKKEEFRCLECGDKLSHDEEYHVKFGTCNSYCYGKMIGEYA